MRIALLVLLMTATVHASPRDDLASPVQEKRDAAAKLIRASFKASPRAQWEKVVASIKKGTTEQAMLAQLAQYKPALEGAGAGGGGTTATYRIDDSWVIVCAFTSEDMKLFDIKLVPDLRLLWVDPPKDFTGVWTTYRANGVRSTEFHYTNGKYDGAIMTFHGDGTKIASKGVYKDGKLVGAYTYYDEAGNPKR